jgi:hypothetical protein
MALTMSLKPRKSMTTWWSMRMSVSDSTVRIVQAAPPSENAVLNISAGRAGIVLPSSRRHSGTSTTESRGMLTSTALSRSALRCIRIVVSERSPSMLSAASPCRLSDPISRMFSALGSSATFSGRSSPSCGVRSTRLMLPLSR